MGWFFAFFVVSGFCSLVYQVVWLRLAVAAFGVTAPIVSLVLSTFMAGLAFGSWGAGRLARRPTPSAAAPLRLYALAELGIALSGDIVPHGLALGRSLLQGTGDVAWGSLGHYVTAGLWIVVVLIPFCTGMGATFPLAMWAIRRGLPARSSRSFSYLYLANVAGAGLGTLASAFVLIEILGFRGTAVLAAGLNALLAAAALALSLRASKAGAAAGPLTAAPEPSAPAPPAVAPESSRIAERGPDTGPLSGASVDPPAGQAAPRHAPYVLFATGLSSMGMEVVWVRQFTPYMGTMVYAFAIIVALYLAGTVAGSAAYRRWCAAAERPRPVSWLWPLLGLAGLLPLVASDPRLPLGPGLAEGAIRVAAGVVPLCALLGFLTPLLVDRWSGGDAERAGRAYAVNVLGCIVGPLVAGFVLLPHLGERASLALLAIALFACGRGAGPLTARRMPQRLAWAGATLLSVLLLAATRDFATRYPRAEVRRDHSATVIAAGEGWNRRLLVNGMGMTYLTPITKFMVHMPMAFLEEPPRRALVICFGMGTSFRSMLSWGVDATAVELVPSVPGLFSYFHEDGPELLRSPRAHVVIDDGRRFLERTPLQFDAITIDPPPPVEAAGSSLLYSREFYEVARERLRAGGILQQWVPNGDEVVIASFTRALVSSFRHVRAWGSVEGTGIHYLASDRPIPARTPAELARRLPPAAAADLVEWGPRRTAEEQFGVVLGRETPVSELLDLAPDVGPLTDDRAFNEYYLLRQRRR